MESDFAMTRDLKLRDFAVKMVAIVLQNASMLGPLLSGSVIMDTKDAYGSGDCRIVLVRIHLPWDDVPLVAYCHCTRQNGHWSLGLCEIGMEDRDVLMRFNCFFSRGALHAQMA